MFNPISQICRQETKNAPPRSLAPETSDSFRSKREKSLSDLRRVSEEALPAPVSRPVRLTLGQVVRLTACLFKSRRPIAAHTCLSLCLFDWPAVCPAWRFLLVSVSSLFPPCLSEPRRPVRLSVGGQLKSGLAFPPELFGFWGVKIRESRLNFCSWLVWNCPVFSQFPLILSGAVKISICFRCFLSETLTFDLLLVKLEPCSFLCFPFRGGCRGRKRRLNPDKRRWF